MSLLTRDYDYALPEELIAQYPPDKRESARMLVVHRDSGELEHRTIEDFFEYLKPEEVVVMNNTRVIPARAFSDDGKIELLFLEPEANHIWVAMVRPGKKMRMGARVQVGGITGEVISILEDGTRKIQFEKDIALEEIGKIPLPPYMTREVQGEDAERYQTVFAREPGAVAAPTAGLHFTQKMIEKINPAFVTLHVGAGTFRPVQVEDLTQHLMHEERFEIMEPEATRISHAPSVLAVGTTVVRVLESVTNTQGQISPHQGRTSIFIHPPYTFKRVNRLLTNFHLPKSTLLMLVSAFAGRELILKAYQEAIAKKYRFYSYGDCMLLI